MTDKEYRIMYEKSAREAQNKLFDEYFNYVYAIVFNKLRSCASKEDIEECVSDVFADVFGHFSSETSYSGDMKGFIGTVAARRAVSCFRSISAKSGKTVPMEGSDADSIADDTDIIRNTEASELRSTLLRLVKELGEPDTAIVMQKYYYGLNSKEIAEIVSMEPAAVRVRCTRALRKLKEKLTALDINLKEAEA